MPLIAPHFRCPSERASLLDEPQLLGLLPTPWYWRRLDGVPAAAVILIGVGLSAGVTAGALVSNVALGVATAVVLAVLALGSIERRIRAVLQARRPGVTSRTGPLASRCSLTTSIRI